MLSPRAIERRERAAKRRQILVTVSLVALFLIALADAEIDDTQLIANRLI